MTCDLIYLGRGVTVVACFCEIKLLGKLADKRKLSLMLFLRIYSLRFC